MSKPAVALPIAQPIPKDKQKTKNKFSFGNSNNSNNNNNNNNNNAVSANNNGNNNNDEVEVSELLTIENVECYSLSNNEKKLLSTGTLQIVSSKMNNSLEEHYIVLFPEGVYELELRLEIPILEMAAHNFIFPAPNNNNALNNSYGLVLPDSIDTDTLEAFILILHQHASFRRAGIELPLTQIQTQQDYVVKTANTVSKGLNSSTQTVVNTINEGSAKLGIYIATFGSYMKTKIQPNEKPTVVSITTKQRVHNAKIVSGAAVKVSKALVMGAVATANALSSQLSAVVSETEFGQSLQTKSSPRVEAAKDVAKSSISAIAAISGSLLQGGLVLVSALGSTTANLVGHKYGAEVHQVSHEAADVVKNVAAATVDMRQVGVKAILAKTVKTTVVDVISTSEEKAEMKKVAGSTSLAIDPLVALDVLSSVNQVQNVINTQKSITQVHAIGKGSADEPIVADAISTQIVTQINNNNNATNSNPDVD